VGLLHYCTFGLEAANDAQNVRVDTARGKYNDQQNLSQKNSATADKSARRVIGQSRSPNIVQFHMLDIVSYCAIVAFSLRRGVFTIFDFRNVVTLKSGSEVTQGH